MRSRTVDRRAVPTVLYMLADVTVAALLAVAAAGLWLLDAIDLTPRP